MHRNVLLSLLAVVAAPVVHAQVVEAYVTATGIHATNVPNQANGIPANTPVSPFGIFRSFGFGGGMSVTFATLPLVKLAVDGRGNEHGGTGGIKVMPTVPFFHVVPFAEGEFGSLDFRRNNKSNGYTIAEALVGVDIPLSNHFAFRAIEFGVGHALGRIENTKPTFINANSGLVYRF